MNRTTRRLAGGLAILAAGATLIGPITALAQSDDDTPSTTVPATADDAGPEPRAWLTEALQPLVDAGTITQAQADAVAAALQAAKPDGGFGGRHGRGGGRISLETAATTIGITEDALRTALESGQTLADVATANGVEPQAVIDALVADARTRLDAAVAEGRIERAEADERLTSLTERITTAVNEGFPARGPGGKGGFPGRPTDDDTTTEDSATPTTEAPSTTEGGS